jgi:hypothetical protein
MVITIGFYKKEEKKKAVPEKFRNAKILYRDVVP